MIIQEGGNVFKDSQGQPATQRINRADVPATIAWLESVLGMPFPEDRWLGSTGRAPTSGDLDLAVDLADADKESIAQRLTQFVQKSGQDPRQWVKKAGEVHFKTPIRGDARNGFVQTDFMFFPNVDWGTFFYAGGTDSSYKGMVRNVLMSSLAKHQGLKVGANGMFSRTTNELVPNGLDPDYVASVLLGAGKTREDLKNVETIYRNLARDPERDAKLADFRAYLEREGLGEPDTTVQESEVSFMARLRDRIVNQGMQPIFEGVRIEHPEDMVFDMGSRGIQQALAGIKATAARPETATVKWDGKPAIIFGRKPTGEFVLTDKSGFLAKGYDGLATSPEHIERIMNIRGGERTELVNIYKKMFPLLRRAVPPDYRGYIQGDLLYSSKPQIANGAYEFTPNTVTYRVAADSELGQKIGASEVGVVIHTAIDQPGGTPTPIRAADLYDSPGLLILDPSIKEARQIQLNAKTVKNIEQLIARYGTAIDQFFNPAALRDRKISDLPQLMKQYINTRVRAGSYDNLIGGFGTWVQQKAPTKAPRIFEWATENKQAVAAVFQSFLELSALKNDVVRQFDSQAHDVQASINNEPGHEGYVSQGVKFVDRMRFSAANFARNNPDLG